MTIRTYQALILALLLLTLGYIWATFHYDSPYAEYAAAVVAVFGGYGYKRLQQKKEQYNSTNEGQGGQAGD